MPYFVMTCEGPDPFKPIAITPDLGISWMLGQPVVFEGPFPITYVLDDEYDGTPKALYAKAHPVMRDDLAQALTDAGVDNLQMFPAILEDREAGKQYTNYKAFNVVGLVSCADMDASRLMGTSASRMGDADFDRLIIDESRTDGLLMFRLAEAVNAIVVSERVRSVIEERGIPGMYFYGPGEWSG